MSGDHIICTLSIVAAAAMAICGAPGWGWFVFLAFVIML